MARQTLEDPDLKTKLHSRATISRVITTGTLRYSAVELMHEVSHVTSNFELWNLKAHLVTTRSGRT